MLQVYSPFQVYLRHFTAVILELNVGVPLVYVPCTWVAAH
jgi:hypothetical protein